MLYTLPFPLAVPASHQGTITKRFTDDITYIWRVTNPDPLLARTAFLEVILPDGRRAGMGLRVSVAPQGQVGDTVDLTRRMNISTFDNVWVPGLNTHTLAFVEALPGGGVADFATHPYTVMANPLQLNIGSDNSPRNNTVSIPVMLEAPALGAQISAFEMRFTYNGTAIPVGVVQAGASLPTGWFFSQNQPTPGDLRVIALDLSGNGTEFSGEIVRLVLTVAANASLGITPISVGLSDFRLPGGALLPTIGIDGLINIF